MYDDNDMIVIIINDVHDNVEGIDDLSNSYNDGNTSNMYKNGSRNSNSNDDNTMKYST